jgi:hypothetical protein
MKRLKDRLELKEGLNGIDFLRMAVHDMGWRDEHYNTEKTPEELLEEYAKFYFDEVSEDSFFNPI